MITEPLATNTLRMARVTYVHPEGQKLEVIFLDTGDMGRDVQVMTPYGGTDFGFTSGIPQPGEEGHKPAVEQWDPKKRHINCVVATMNGMHVCLGFVYPQVTHMAFTRDRDMNRLVERHTSDFVRTISDAGDMDMTHPSGAYLRIGEGEDPDELAGHDYDGVYELKHNLEKRVTITLKNASGTGQTKLVLCPSGDIDVFATRNARVRVFGDIAIEATENLSLTAGGTLSLAAPDLQICTANFPTTEKPWLNEPCKTILPPEICTDD